MKKRLISIILAMVLIIGAFPYNKVEAVRNNPWVQSSYPFNNQGTIDSQRVERNPLIKINFKHQVDLVDKSKISLSSDGITYAVDLSQDTWVTYDGYTLKIDINSASRGGEHPLRANAAYKLTIEEGALRRKDSSIKYPEEQMKNKKMDLYFITGPQNHFGGSDQGLKVERYTSTPVNPFDDITTLQGTNLGEDGSIYIHFNRPIKWNRWTANPKVENDLQALPYFKLLKTPIPYGRSLDPYGNIYESEFRYDINRNSIPPGNEQVQIKSVEILKDTNGNNTNIIKITPRDRLIPLNKYIIQLTKKDIITDNYEKILLNDINQEIWTAPIYGDKPNWDMNLISAEQIIENHKGPKKSYTIHGAPNYNEYIDEEKGKPIILYVDKEIIPNPYEPNPLTGIKLFEGYREGDTSSVRRNIKWYQLEYFYYDGIKKTKISLYPEKELHSGRYYKVEIEDKVFKSRSNLGLEEIYFDFVIEGDKTIGRGIYKFKTTPNHINFLISDFLPEKPDVTFDVIGYNFTEDIRQLRFVRVGDGKTITVSASDLKFYDVTKITGIITGNAKLDFARIIGGTDYGPVDTSAGTYDIFIDFNTGTSAGLYTPDDRFMTKDRPKVIGTTPTNGKQYFDSEDLYEKFLRPEEEGYYIKVVFENIGGTLKLLNDLPTGITVSVEGETGANLVNQSKNIRYESTSDKFIIYIPLTAKPSDGQKYNVFIPETTVVEYDDLRKEDGDKNNRGYKFSFGTNYYPKADRLYEGSVPEFYDYNYPIAIDGSLFHRNTQVKFRSMDGTFYNADKVVIKDNNKTLYIFLPRNPRLPIGLYDIIISNGKNYDIEMKYGVLSVVEQGRYIPNEEYRVKDENSIGVVKEIIKTSKDIIDLNTRNAYKDKLEINLDELMGSKVWVRTIEYPATWGDALGQLILKSKWANANIKNLKLHEDSDERQIQLRVGRVEPTVADIIKKKIINNNIKSDFIEISGANFDFDSISIEIPYFESDGTSLKMLRYDEMSRKFEEVLITRDLINGKIIGISYKPGIFVIVD